MYFWFESLFIHPSQDEVNPETEKDFKKRYPSLKDCKFFFVSCRPNYELYSRFASFGESVVIVEPKEIRDNMLSKFSKAVENYQSILDQ